MRHWADEVTEGVDSDSQLPHIYQTTWNALARLELYLIEQERLERAFAKPVLYLPCDASLGPYQGSGGDFTVGGTPRPERDESTAATNEDTGGNRPEPEPLSLPADDEVEPASEDIAIKHFFRILISKLDGAERWSIISNPSWCSSSRACSEVLKNAANKYSEYLNCGVQHRMIRVEDLREYGFRFEDLRLCWTLNPLELLEPPEPTAAEWPIGKELSEVSYINITNRNLITMAKQVLRDVYVEGQDNAYKQAAISHLEYIIGRIPKIEIVPEYDYPHTGLLAKLNRYVQEEDFPKEHLEALLTIACNFNESKETEDRIFCLAKDLQEQTNHE